MAKKEITKDLTERDFISSLLLLKPKSGEGSGRFDAKRLYDTLRENVQLTRQDPNSLDRMLSILRRNHAVYRHSDEMPTEIYYIKDAACKAIKDDLEKRLGLSYLRKFGLVAREIWEHYYSLVPVKR